jgi:uncharacterized damage-inducible protein DinB
MTEADSTLLRYYSGWEVFQRDTVAATSSLTPEQLGLRSAPPMWSVGMLLTHMVAARASWFHGWMEHGPAELVRYPAWDETNDSPRSAAELVQGLEATWEMIHDGLSKWNADDLDQSFTSPYNPARPPRTRQWIIWHVLEHDLRHGGEVSLTLGMHGVAGIDF